MEKLLELLNEYDKINKYINKWIRDEYGRLDREYGWSTVTSSCWKVISKDYGFIKWLVQNEKIDFEGKLNTLRFESLVDQTLDSYLALLMLLSIQDEPINFLVSILK